jgi:hypothetical protein
VGHFAWNPELVLCHSERELGVIVLKKYLPFCAPSSMRLITCIALSLICTSAFSQDDNLIRLAFTDKSNFDITTFLDHKRPEVYYVLSKTSKWHKHRFQLDEDLASDSVRMELENDEHSYYNHTYIFKDPFLDSLFDKAEKRHLYKRSQSIEPRTLTGNIKQFNLIKSFGVAKNGFFFAITDPVFTRDKQYAFIDISIYNKYEDTEDLNTSIFGTTLLVYQNIKGRGWTRIRKRDYLIL